MIINHIQLISNVAQNPTIQRALQTGPMSEIQNEMLSPNHRHKPKYYNVIQNVAFTQIQYNVRLSTLIPILCMLGLTWMNR